MYDSTHRFLLRLIASQGVLSLSDAGQALESFVDNCETSIPVLVKEINDEIRPYQQTIKIVNDEITDEKVLIFLSLGYDDATKAQNLFAPTELEYFRLLIEEIMSTATRQVTGIHAINLVGKMKTSFTKTDAQKLLSTYCRMRYLDKDNNNYALGIRAIHEFDSYLRENMPDAIEECCLCKKIVFRGYNCPACEKAVHTQCLNQYLEKVEKWPCCKANYSATQLERLNQESSRFTQTQRLEATQNAEELNNATEQVSQEALNEEVEMTQELIPEISQRTTRKRKRSP